MIRTISKLASLQGSSLRCFHMTALSRLREIVVEKKNDKTTVIDCRYVESPRKPYILKTETSPKSDKCPLCKLQLNLKYTDVLILSQYLDSRGNVLQKCDTDLCKDQYKLVKELIYMAQYAGLLPEPESTEPKKPYQLLNTYYDEKTINLRPKRVKHHNRYFYLKGKMAPLERFRVNPDVGVHYGRKLS